MTAKSSKLIRGATGDWEVVIGMEVHAQVSSEAKLFSGASTEFGAPPNSVEAPEKSFASEETWACTSMPITTSQSPVAPRINFELGLASMRLIYGSAFPMSCVLELSEHCRAGGVVAGKS